MADVLSNSSHGSFLDGKGSPAKNSESPPTSLAKTTDSIPICALERSKICHDRDNLSFSSLNKSECSFTKEQSWQQERPSDFAPKKQSQFWFAPQAQDLSGCQDEDHPIFSIGENFENKIDFESGYAPF